MLNRRCKNTADIQLFFCHSSNCCKCLYIVYINKWRKHHIVVFCLLFVRKLTLETVLKLHLMTFAVDLRKICQNTHKLNFLVLSFILCQMKPNIAFFRFKVWIFQIHLVLRYYLRFLPILIQGSHFFYPVKFPDFSLTFPWFPKIFPRFFLSLHQDTLVKKTIFILFKCGLHLPLG